MVWLAGEAAIVTHEDSGTASGIARALAAAGARVALIGTDRTTLADAVCDLRDDCCTVAPILLERSGNKGWAEATARAEAAIGPLSLYCDVAAEAAGSTQPFHLCRWVRHPGGNRSAAVLKVRPISGLAAMGLLIPGALPGSVEHTRGVAAARLFGPGRDRASVEDERPPLREGAGPAEIGRQVVGLLAADAARLITTRREWEGRCRSLVASPSAAGLPDLCLGTAMARSARRLVSA